MSTAEIIKNNLHIDSENLLEVIKAFPSQIEQAIEIGKNCPMFTSGDKINKIIVLGMGGSAIGGDLLRSFTNGIGEEITISVNRNYTLPAYLDKSYHFIASSYSGTTEETLSAYNFAKNISKNILAITTGGELKQKALSDKFPVIEIPAGFQPRAALGYSFFPTLSVLLRCKAYSEKGIETTYSAFEELVPLLKERAVQYGTLDDSNPAVLIAGKLLGKLPVIYSADEKLDAVNLRWRGQIQENAKNAAFGNFLPEMNHNEINGWTYPAQIKETGIAVFLTDPEDNERTALRFQALRSVIEENGNEVIELTSKGEHLLTRIFDLIYLADWVSFYLAMLNKVDPTPIPLINRLKNFLAGS